MRDGRAAAPAAAASAHAADRQATRAAQRQQVIAGQQRSVGGVVVNAGAAGEDQVDDPAPSPLAAESGDASMVVHTRARDLLEWLVPHVAKWPREQRHTVTRHVSDLAMQVLDALVAARHLSPAQRATSLREADIRLDQLRQYLQMAWQWGWMAGNQYEHVSRLTAELGRLIGGWRRAVAADAAEGGPRRGSESPRRGPV